MLFIGLLFLYYRFCLGMTSAAGNEIAKAKLPAEVTIAEFLSWTSGKFYNYFPKKRERYPISLGLYTCRYKEGFSKHNIR